MTFLGSFETKGGPVCISPSSLAKQWTGIDGDYDQLVRKKYSEMIDSVTGVRGVEYLLFVTETGNFQVLQGDQSFTLFEIRYAANAEVVARMDFSRSVSDSPLRQVKQFGGLLFLFDSALPGEEIKLRGPGVQCSFPQPKYNVPDVVAIEVPVGTWSIFPMQYKTKATYVRGVHFQYILSPARE
jgi:hypothetical protein